jgi:hypothetical protein
MSVLTLIKNCIGCNQFDAVQNVRVIQKCQKFHMSKSEKFLARF